MSTTDEVLAAARQLIQAFGRHDTAAYFDCFAPDATFIFYTTAARLASRAEYQRLWRQWEDEDEFRVLSCASAQPVVQDLGDAGVFSHDVTTVIRTRPGEQTLTERETIVFRRDGRPLDRRARAPVAAARTGTAIPGRRPALTPRPGPEKGNRRHEHHRRGLLPGRPGTGRPSGKP